MKKLLLVKWGDAHSRQSWVEVDQALKDHKPSVCYSVGWLLKRDKTGITLYGSLSEDSDIGNTQFIPKGMIQAVKTLGRS